VNKHHPPAEKAPKTIKLTDPDDRLSRNADWLCLSNKQRSYLNKLWAKDSSSLAGSACRPKALHSSAIGLATAEAMPLQMDDPRGRCVWPYPAHHTRNSERSLTLWKTKLFVQTAA